MRLENVWFPRLLGFFLIANVYLFPVGGRQVRATDMIGLFMGLLLLKVIMLRQYWRRSMGALLLMGLSPLIWTIVAVSQQDVGTLVLALRWLLAVPWGYFVSVLMRDAKTQQEVLWGMVAGIVVNVLTLFLQRNGMSHLASLFGLVPMGTTPTARPSGMHGHANAAMAVVSLLAPIGVLLVLRYRKGIHVVAVGSVLLFAAGAITSTRSAVLVALVTVLLGLLLSRDRWATRLAVACATGIVLTLVTIGPPGGWDRWLDLDNLKLNSTERLHTTITAAELALQHPLGVGVSRTKDLLLAQAGMGVTHNAILHIALVFGIAMAGFLLAVLVVSCCRIWEGIHGPYAVEAVFALHMLGLFAFEEHLNNPTFINTTAWLVAALPTLVNGCPNRQAANGE